jgi:hypothetical protein
MKWKSLKDHRKFARTNNELLAETRSNACHTLLSEKLGVKKMPKSAIPRESPLIVVPNITASQHERRTVKD